MRAALLSWALGAPPVRLAALSFDGSEEHPGTLSRDGRRLYMSSGRLGTQALYVATRDCQ